MSYLRPSARQCSTPQRRRILYCQKGFLCRCYACAAVADPYRCGREDAVRDGATAGWLTHAHLQEERALPVAHLRARRGAAAESQRARGAQDAALASRAADLLGDGHFATQAFRRVLLAQGAATRRWTEAEQSQADGCLRYLSSRAAAVAGAEPGANRGSPEVEPGPGRRQTRQLASDSLWQAAEGASRLSGLPLAWLRSKGAFPV
eukprot:CAMPEP_0179210512 /NCGR_PEP_ID=MMETSP0796-20121207/104994_1 /TAXON_ID=73915 /ORGANISM="Pyrodinium bahamense, Strain pbaha01" /LENGTH=205 /DNA_ID=CAMNT_0020915477 /DNA_START=93 /DNA_END=712 /DNA_ORIENTATION=-